MKTTFIYALKELVPGEFFSTKIRYIGKANDPYKRFKNHCVSQEKSYRGNWIRSLPGRGLSLQLEILDEVPESEWEFWEREYIQVFRAIGFRLVNGTEGGDGLTNPSSETRAKIGAASRNCSVETRAKMRAARLGKPRLDLKGKKRGPNKKRISAEGRARMRAAWVIRRLDKYKIVSDTTKT